jgi:hypothetical protein
MFDPYQAWLGILTSEQPPNHYQLLGIEPHETDSERIKEAALRQTSRLRALQLGPHAELCTRLLNEIAQARATLANPKSREEYDQRLRPSAAAVDAAQEFFAIPAESIPSGPLQSQTHIQRHKRGADWSRRLALLAYLAFLICSGGATYWLTAQHLESVAHKPSVSDKHGPAVKPVKDNRTTPPSKEKAL